MMILKQAEFGKKNKGGGKIKPNLSSNKHYTNESKKQAEKELEKALIKQKEKDVNAAKKLVKTVKDADLKNTTKRVFKGAVETAGKNKKVLAGATVGAAVLGTGAVAAKKAHDKKRKMFATTSDGEPLKLFSKKEEKGTAQTIAEDASSAAALGAAGGLGYTAVQGGKALLSAKEAAKSGGTIKSQIQAARKLNPEQVARDVKSNLNIVKNPAKIAKHLGKAGKGTKIAASAAGASIIAGGAAKLIGAKKNKKD